MRKNGIPSVANQKIWREIAESVPFSLRTFPKWAPEKVCDALCLSEFALEEDSRKESLWRARNSRGKRDGGRERERERERERLSGAIKLLKYGIGGGTSLDSSVQSRQPVAKAKGKGSV